VLPKFKTREYDSLSDIALSIRVELEKNLGEVV